MNILIPNIGRRGYLVRYLKQTDKFDHKVFVSDCDNTASGLYGDNDGAYILPRPVDDEEAYVDALMRLCVKCGIHIIIPVIDPEIFILSKYREMFRTQDIFVSVSDEKVLDICYDKTKMNRFLNKYDFRFPRTYTSISAFMQEHENHRISFPVVIKPIFGSGSESTYIPSDSKELEALFRQGMMIQEFIEGTEYGIDVFNDLNSNPVRCVIKRKISMRSGETDKSEIIRNDRIQETILRLAKCLGHICNLDCDIIVKNDVIYIIDLNPRFGGGYPATHESGVDLLELVCMLACNESIGPDYSNKNTGMTVMKEIAVVTTKELIR